MKKVTGKMWWYGINFLLRNLFFNTALGFGVAAFVFFSQGFTRWALIATIFTSMWFLEQIIVHILWAIMKKNERALFLAIRKAGKKLVTIKEKEIDIFGQNDLKEIVTDVDNGLEIQMVINGTGTFINAFIGIKWLKNAWKFHKNELLIHFQN